MADPIDLSAGLEPKAAPQTAPAASGGNIDLSAGMESAAPTRTPATGLTGVLSGIGGGVMETAEGAKKLAEMGGVIPKGLVPDIPKSLRENTSPSEQIGGGMENIAEYFLGDAALERAVKMVSAAQKYPIVAKTLELAREHPVLEKILTGAGKGAAVGGAQGAVKGAAEGQTAKGAEGGALGGAVGGTAAEIATELSAVIGKRLGIGTTAVEDATRGFKPAKRNVKFADNFQKAAPIIDAEPSFKEATNVRDQVEAIDTARNNWWQQNVQPLVDKYKGVPLDGTNIANSIRAAIPDTMKKYAAPEAAKMEQLANEFIPGGQLGSEAIAVPAHNTFVGDAEAALEHYNAMLSGTGYWSKMPGERAALLKTNGDLAGYAAAADAIRDELYRTLEVKEPGMNMEARKQIYGALRNVGDELRGQINVQGRQAPTSLKELVGLTAGIATGGVKGALAAVVPFMDRNANTAEKLAARAVRKAARPAEKPLLEKAGNAAGNVIRKVAPAAGAGVGEQVGEGMGPSSENRVTFQSSDGATHSVPEEHLDAARQIDPNLKVIES